MVYVFRTDGTEITALHYCEYLVFDYIPAEAMRSNGSENLPTYFSDRRKERSLYPNAEDVKVEVRLSTAQWGIQICLFRPFIQKFISFPSEC